MGGPECNNTSLYFSEKEWAHVSKYVNTRLFRANVINVATTRHPSVANVILDTRLWQMSFCHARSGIASY